MSCPVDSGSSMGPFISAPLTRKERKREKSFPPILGFPCFLFSLLLLLLLLLLFHSAPILSSCCLSRRIRSNTPDRRRLSRKPKLAAADFFFGYPHAHCFLFSHFTPTTPGPEQVPARHPSANPALHPHIGRIALLVRVPLWYLIILALVSTVVALPNQSSY